MRSFLLTLATATSILFSTVALTQETQYVRDTLYVELRTGQSFKHRIVHRGLVSGTPLTILEVSEDKKYTRVKTDKGIEGWIQTQYLMDKPSARNQLKASQAKQSQLTNQNAALKKQLGELKAQYQAAQKQSGQLSSNSRQLQKELADIKAISANALQLDRDVTKLRLSNQELSNKVDLLTADNQRLSDDNSSDAFLNGAFAVLIGVFITLIVPRLWPSKSNDWA